MRTIKNCFFREGLYICGLLSFIGITFAQVPETYHRMESAYISGRVAEMMQSEAMGR